MLGTFQGEDVLWKKILNVLNQNGDPLCLSMMQRINLDTFEEKGDPLGHQ